MAEYNPRNNALTTVTQFEHKRGRFTDATGDGYPNIDRRKFAQQLRDRVNNPHLINQCGASLCGPAAVMYCWVKDHPDKFVDYITELYEKGQGKLGDMDIRPGKSNRNFTPKNTVNLYNPPIQGTDWVALAALRDARNLLLDYNREDEQIAGITRPSEIKKWFSKIGFTVLEDKTNIFFDASFSTLNKAIEHYRNNCSVCLFISAQVIQGGGKFKQHFIPDHWVVMTSDIKIDGRPASTSDTSKDLLDKPIEGTFYTWGNDNYSINKGRSTSMTVREFLENFHGFIAAI